MTTYYMACLSLERRRVLVVGAGRIALEKIAGLLACDANVHVVALQVEPDVAELESFGRISIDRRAFEVSDVEGAFLVIAATDDMDVNTQVFHAADERSIPVNVVDVPALCSFILPAINLPTYDDRKAFFEEIVSGDPDPIELLRRDES
jgi:precorrin-2 dehydrogenase / sirohydrochlorin ferrochelatase